MGQTAKFRITTFVFAALLSGRALAQPAAPADRPPASEKPGADTGGADIDAEALPDVKDPMLEPVPPAPNVVSSWKDVVRFIHQRSTTLHIAAAGVEQANGEARSKLAASLPTLSANSTLNHHVLHGTGRNVFAPGGVAVSAPIPDPDTVLVGSIDLRQPLVNLGAWYSRDTAKERVKVADLSAQDTQRQVIATVALAAVDVITKGRVAESSRVSLASGLSTLDLTERRAALGAANAVDVLRAAQEVSVSRATLVTADESLRQAREALGAALGFTGGWGVAPSLTAEELERTASTICKPLPGVEHRSDILSAESSVRAAERDRTAVDLTYVPTVDFVSSVGLTSYKEASANGKPVTWTIGGRLVWPLFDGGDRYGKARSANAAQTIAREQLTQKTRDATLEVTQADRAITVARTNLEVATTARNIAKESARLSRLAFINGNGTSFDLVDSARRLREAEIDLLIKEFGIFQARLTAFLSRANCAI
jgi:multidrug efflux system outer membrane protein